MAVKKIRSKSAELRFSLGKKGEETQKKAATVGVVRYILDENGLHLGKEDVPDGADSHRKKNASWEKPPVTVTKGDKHPRGGKPGLPSPQTEGEQNRGQRKVFSFRKV